MTSLSPVTPLSSGADITNPPTTSATGAANSNDSLTSEDTFLKLLVAQIKNQDPTNPTDPVQFVGQLTQYSELEQLMQINSGVATLTGAASAPPASSGDTPNGSAGNPLAPTSTTARTQQ